MGYSDKETAYRWRAKTNSEALDSAKKHRDYWSQEHMDRIMDDDVLALSENWKGAGHGGVKQLCSELGRTWIAIVEKRREIKTDLEKELNDLDDTYDGPIIPDTEGYGMVGIPIEETPEYQYALRQACIKLTCSSIRTTEHEPGSEEHQYELMSLYSMLGLME